MSLIPHSFFPRSMFDVANWFNPTLEAFDPFDELDHMLGTNMEWLQRPSFMEPLPLVPRIPDKYRISIDCAGYNPKSLKTEFKDGKLYVTGKEEVKNTEDDYSIREFKKTYELPPNCEIDKLASFFAGGHLIVEVPLKVVRKQEDLFPKIIDTKDGKQLQMSCIIPQGIDPSKLNVTCKDRDLIIRAEDKIEKPDNISKKFYYRRVTLPENTDFDALKCHFENGKLAIEAPVLKALTHHRKNIAIGQKPIEPMEQKKITN